MRTKLSLDQDIRSAQPSQEIGVELAHQSSLLVLQIGGQSTDGLTQLALLVVMLKAKIHSAHRGATAVLQPELIVVDNHPG